MSRHPARQCSTLVSTRTTVALRVAPTPDSAFLIATPSDRPIGVVRPGTGDAAACSRLCQPTARQWNASHGCVLRPRACTNAHDVLSTCAPRPCLQILILAALGSSRCSSGATSWRWWVEGGSRDTRPTRCMRSSLVKRRCRPAVWPTPRPARTDRSQPCCAQVMIWDDHQNRCIGELSFRSEVKAVRRQASRTRWPPPARHSPLSAATEPLRASAAPAPPRTHSATVVDQVRLSSTSPASQLHAAATRLCGSRPVPRRIAQCLSCRPHGAAHRCA